MNPDFRDILSEFSAAKVEFLLVGAYAMASLGLARSTWDIDGVGHASLLAVMSAFAFLSLQQLARFIVMIIVDRVPDPSEYFWVFGILEHLTNSVGAAIIAVWPVLWRTQMGWRPTDWLDRLGMIVGIIWLLWGLTRGCLSLINPDLFGRLLGPR